MVVQRLPAIISSMRVAIDSGSLTSGHSVRGIGVMVREQIQALKSSASKEHKKIKIEAFDFLANNQQLTTNNYDIVHYPYFFPYALTLPSLKQGKKTIVTIQDLIHLIYPEKYPPGIRGKINFLKQKIRLKNIDAVITISETSKKDIVRFLGISPEKIFVVYLAAKKVFRKLEIGNWKLEIKKRYSLPDRFALYVGDINYNKNIPNLIKACRIAKTPLVICGKQAFEIEEKGMDLKYLKGPRDWIRYVFNIPHPELAHYSSLLEEFKGNKNIIRTGFVPDEDLVYIFNLASLYIQPSLYEGFGIPVLEAMACGTPVVISKTNALVEISGDAALVTDPKSPKDMANKIKIVLNKEDIRKQLIEKGFNNIERFSWEKTAKQMLDVYKKVFGMN